MVDTQTFDITSVQGTISTAQTGLKALIDQLTSVRVGVKGSGDFKGKNIILDEIGISLRRFEDAGDRLEKLSEFIGENPLKAPTPAAPAAPATAASDSSDSQDESQGGGNSSSANSSDSDQGSSEQQQ